MPPGRHPRAAGRALDRLAGRVFALPRATTGYTVARGIRVPVRDGVELAADLYRPDSRAVGTVLVRGPYGRSMLQALPMARVLAARGFNALFVSSRGTFGSGGEFSPMRSEIEDGHDVVDWMRDQDWYTGTFATLGGSYLGFTQWALLTDPPPDLVAAVISIAPHDFSRHVWGTGAFKLDFLAWSAMIVHQEDTGALRGALRMATAERRNASAMNELPLVALGDGHLEGRAPWFADWVTRPDLRDPFWAPMQLGDALERASVPVLLISGWQDLFLEQTVQQYARLRERGVEVALTVGPWTHISVGAGAAPITTSETLDWLQAHVAGHALQRRAAVRVFVTGADEWRELPEWPSSTAPHTLYLGPHRDLTPGPPEPDAPASSFLFDPTDPTPTVGGPLMALRDRVDDSELARRADVLSFTGAPLTEDLEIMGAPLVELVHASDNPHADLFVRLSEVDEEGISRRVTEGYLRLDPARAPGPVTLALRPAAHRFGAGRRVRLLVAGGSHPQFARNLGTSENPGTGIALHPARHTVRHGEGGISSATLPAVADPGRRA
jgi:uncharacterized protein